MSENNHEPIAFVAPTLEKLDSLLTGYEFESFIAQGGMGAVYLASQTSLDRKVAIKVLPKELGDDEKFRQSFQDEAKHMAKLNHLNLIGIYDFGDMDGMLYIIMEFVKGKSLHDSARGKAIVQEKAATIVRDVCLGLDHAHDAGILHRDIKPANILLGKGAVPKIGDFGLARPHGNVETGVIYGTPGYAAPEVLNAPDEVDSQTDVFAVGVMFYELLTGQMPDEKYVPVQNLVEADPRFDNIIRKAIHPNSKMRYASAGELAEDITDVLKELEDQENAPVNPLLANTGAVSAVARPNALELTSPVKLPSNTPLASGSTVPPSTAPVVSSSGGNAIRNILIIFILLGALFAALNLKEKKTAEVKELEANNKAENAAIAEANEKVRQEKLKERKRISDERLKDKKGQLANMATLEDSTPLEQLEKSKYDLSTGKREKTYFP